MVQLIRAQVDDPDVMDAFGLTQEGCCANLFCRGYVELKNLCSFLAGRVDAVA